MNVVGGRNCWHIKWPYMSWVGPREGVRTNRICFGGEWQANVGGLGQVQLPVTEGVTVKLLVMSSPFHSP